MFDIAAITRIIETAIDVTPSFIALAEKVADAIDGDDQEDFKAALASARGRAAAAHQRVQDAAADAAQG